MLNNIQNNILCFIYRKPKIFPKFIYTLISFLKKKYRFEKKIDHSFLISSESGIWLCNKENKLRRIFPCYSFGIFLDKNRLYIGISSQNISNIISIDFYNKGLRNKPKLHYSQKTLYHNERIHQLVVRENYIFHANTCSNAITILSKENSKDSKVINIFPFHDLTGYPICRDVNHINSIFPLIDGIVFVAHNGGNLGSIIGIIFNKTCKFYAYKSRGCHDIFVNDKDLIFSDSFGHNILDKKGSKKTGSIFYNKKNIYQQSHFTRGIFLGKDQNLIGSSFHSKRDLRFSGNGEINITDKNFNPLSTMKLPFAQFHDIIGLENSFNEKKLHNIPAKEIDMVLEKYLGSLIFESNYSVQSSYKNQVSLKENNLNYLDLISSIE